MKGWEIRKMAEFSKENPAAEEAKGACFQKLHRADD